MLQNFVTVIVLYIALLGRTAQESNVSAKNSIKILKYSVVRSVSVSSCLFFKHNQRNRLCSGMTLTIAGNVQQVEPTK